MKTRFSKNATAFALAAIWIALGGVIAKGRFVEAKPPPSTALAAELEVQRTLGRELGKDWKLQVRAGLPPSPWKHGIEIFGSNERLRFEPPGPKGQQYASLHFYLHPLTIEQLPVATQCEGSLLSMVVGETDTHRLYGGVLLPKDKKFVLTAVRRALGVRWGQSQNGLRCRLEVPKGPIVVSEKAEVTLVLQNVGKEPIRIPVPLSSWPNGQRIGLANLDERFGLDPKPIHSPLATSNSTLAPGREIRQRLRLDDWIVREDDKPITTRPGRHTIRGFYSPGAGTDGGYAPGTIFTVPTEIEIRRDEVDKQRKTDGTTERESNSAVIDGLSMTLAPGKPVFEPTETVYLDVTVTNPADTTRHLGVCPAYKNDEGQKTTELEINGRRRSVGGVPCYVHVQCDVGGDVRLNSNGYSDRYKESIELESGEKAAFRVAIPAFGPTGRLAVFSRFAVARTADGPRTIANGPESAVLIVDPDRLGRGVAVLKEALAGKAKKTHEIEDAVRAVADNPAPEYADLIAKVVQHPWPSRKHIEWNLWYAASKYVDPDIYRAAAEEAADPGIDRVAAKLVYETLYRNRRFLAIEDVRALLNNPRMQSVDFVSSNRNGYLAARVAAVVAGPEELAKLARFVPSQVSHDFAHHYAVDRRIEPIREAFLNPKHSETAADIMRDRLDRTSHLPFAEWLAELKDIRSIPILERYGQRENAAKHPAEYYAAPSLIAQIDGTEAMLALRRLGRSAVRQRAKLGDPNAIDEVLEHADDLAQNELYWHEYVTRWMAPVPELTAGGVNWKKSRSPFIRDFKAKYGFHPDQLLPPTRVDGEAQDLSKEDPFIRRVSQVPFDELLNDPNKFLSLQDNKRLAGNREAGYLYGRRLATKDNLDGKYQVFWNLRDRDEFVQGFRRGYSDGVASRIHVDVEVRPIADYFEAVYTATNTGRAAIDYFKYESPFWEQQKKSQLGEPWPDTPPPYPQPVVPQPGPWPEAAQLAKGESIQQKFGLSRGKVYRIAIRFMQTLPWSEDIDLTAEAEDPLPGSTTSLDDVLGRKEFAFVGRCEALEHTTAEPGPSGISGAKQKFKLLEVLAGSGPKGQTIQLAYSIVVIAQPPESLIIKGEQVLWVVWKGGDTLVGVKALADTQENRKAVAAAATAEIEILTLDDKSRPVAIGPRQFHSGPFGDRRIRPPAVPDGGEEIAWGEAKNGVRIGLSPKTVKLKPDEKTFTVRVWYENVSRQLQRVPVHKNANMYVLMFTGNTGGGPFYVGCVMERAETIPPGSHSLKPGERFSETFGLGLAVGGGDTRFYLPELKADESLTLQAGWTPFDDAMTAAHWNAPRTRTSGEAIVKVTEEPRERLRTSLSPLKLLASDVKYDGEAFQAPPDRITRQKIVIDRVAYYRSDVSLTQAMGAEDAIRPGDSKQKVIGLLGQPRDQHKSEHSWSYFFAYGTPLADSTPMATVTVWFDGDKVRRVKLRFRPAREAVESAKERLKPGTTAQQVRKLFGRPRKTAGNRWRYSWEYNRNTEFRLDVTFAKNQTVAKVDVRSAHVDPR